MYSHLKLTKRPLPSNVNASSAARPRTPGTTAGRYALVALLALLIAASFTSAGHAANLLVNPSFELDDDGDGFPDGWGTPADARGELVEGGSDGQRAVAFTEGYIVLEQNLSIEPLADLNLRLRLDARSPDGAQLGVFVGHLHVDEDGNAAWRNHRLLWNRDLSDQYTTHRLSYRLPADAQGPRLWIAIYRSNSSGTLFIDSTSAATNTLTPDEQVSIRRIEREWRYLGQRVARAKERLGAHAALDAIAASADEVEEGCFDGDAQLLTTTDAQDQMLSRFCARLNRLLHPDRDLAVSFADPHIQLAPDDILPADLVERGEIVALPSEHHGVGLIVASGADATLECDIALTGLPADDFACQLRRQAFLETWYRKEETRLADPLPLLPSENGLWKLTVAPGEIVKLVVEVHCLRGPAEAQAEIRITSSEGQEIALPMKVQVLTGSAPPADSFGHIAFIYPGSSTAGHSPELTAADMGAHGVNMMEFPRLPPSEFTPEGRLLSADFTTQEAWLKAYCPHVKQMMIFWGPAYGEFSCGEEEYLTPYTEPWNRAFVELFTAFFGRAEELGYGMDRFVIMPHDESHSANLASSPDQRIASTVAVMKLCREKFPELPTVVTLTYYAFPKDVAEMAPYIDIAVPHWPYPTQLGAKYAPPEYNPRQALAQEIWPTLVRERERRGMQIWSYHVAGGKSDGVLTYNRAYPIRAVGAGQTGVSTWAYNVSRGSTWDDTDGGLLDYIYVYDGTEDHPQNRRLNPVGEVVVPSVRWQALRAGIQDARVLLFLKNALATGACPADVQTRARAALAVAEAMASDDDQITWGGVADLSRELRYLYAAMALPSEP